MPTRTTPWPAGTPCWADVPIGDHAAADPFYRAVLGWEFEPANEQMGGYANAYVGGEHVVGSMSLIPGQPAAWTLYFASTDADATVAAVTEHGGSVIAPVMDVMGLGRFAILQDPTGAVFGVWEAGTHTGTRVYGEPGAIAWEDLRSTDPAAARAFYAAVFGFAYEPIPMASADYQTFAPAAGEPPLGGMGGFMGGPEGPSHWDLYFVVADVDAALADATEHGGSVLAPAFDSPYGRMASVADPGGAAFLVIAPVGPTPDRP